MLNGADRIRIVQLSRSRGNRERYKFSGHVLPIVESVSIRGPIRALIAALSQSRISEMR